jgi:hypothetical protein
MTILKLVCVLSKRSCPTDTSVVLVEVKATRRPLENTHEVRDHAASLQVYTRICPVSFTCSGSENVPSRLFVVQLPRT